MLKIKKGDVVSVISGKDKGKTGKVIKVFHAESKALVERVNIAKKHVRKRSEEQHAGVIEVERPIHISNVMFFCKTCNRPVKVGFSVAKDGSKSRICKKCEEAI